MTAGGYQVTLVSTDKGYCQPLSPSIQIRDYIQKRWLDMPFVARHFGVQPQELTDFERLARISSSNIPGVAGIGPTSAAQLITEAGTQDALYQRFERLPENGVTNGNVTVIWRFSAVKWPHWTPP